MSRDDHRGRAFSPNGRGRAARQTSEHAFCVEIESRFVFTRDKRIVAASRYHGGVVRAEHGRRHEQRKAVLFALGGKLRAKVRIRRHSSREREVLFAALFGAAYERIHGVTHSFRGE